MDRCPTLRFGMNFATKQSCFFRVKKERACFVAKVLLATTSNTKLTGNATLIFPGRGIDLNTIAGFAK
jgi:hypothetical protein